MMSSDKEFSARALVELRTRYLGAWIMLNGAGAPFEGVSGGAYVGRWAGIEIEPGRVGVIIDDVMHVTSPDTMLTLHFECKPDVYGHAEGCSRRPAEVEAQALATAAQPWPEPADEPALTADDMEYARKIVQRWAKAGEYFYARAYGHLAGGVTSKHDLAIVRAVDEWRNERAAAAERLAAAAAVTAERFGVDDIARVKELTGGEVLNARRIEPDDMTWRRS